MRIGGILLLAAAFSACGDLDREARELARLDPAEASLRIRGKVESCAGFSRVLDLLTRSQLSGRVLAGLVDDAVEVARERCAQPAEATTGTGTAHQLARARLLDDRPAEALAGLAGASDEPAIRFRRAELLDRQGRTREALADLDAAIARAPDDAAVVARRTLQISADVRAGRYPDVARAIAEAPLTERPSLAFRAAADTPLTGLYALGAAASLEPELASAVADRLEQERGPVAALAARESAAATAPDRAEHHDALGRSLVAVGRIDDALAAWDRAAAIAPAQPTYRLAPIRALVALGHDQRARTRVLAIVKAARAATDVEAALTASSAASAIGDKRLAVELAREAQRRRPADGRLAFLLAERLAEAGDRPAAAAAYAELLVCGARGRAWHRHEVAGRLVLLATDAAAAKVVLTALETPRTCVTAEPADLATYVDAARGKLARTAPK